jgi:hypothetical protein
MENNLNVGKQLRDEGMERVLANTSKEWKNRFETAITTLANLHIPFDVVDVRLICGDPPGHPNAFGAMMNSVVRRKLIKQLTHATIHSTRPPAHGRRLMLYTGMQD